MVRLVFRGTESVQREAMRPLFCCQGRTRCKGMEIRSPGHRLCCLLAAGLRRVEGQIAFSTHFRCRESIACLPWVQTQGERWSRKARGVTLRRVCWSSRSRQARLQAALERLWAVDRRPVPEASQSRTRYTTRLHCGRWSASMLAHPNSSITIACTNSHPSVL